MEATPQLDAVLARVDRLYAQACWPQAYALLAQAIDQAGGEEATVGRLKLALVHGYNQDDFKRGLRHREEKHALLDEIEEVAERGGETALLAGAVYERGMALHIEFVMADGNFERELQCFSGAAEIFGGVGMAEESAMAKAMLGVCHHVVRLDREAAWPILLEAHEMAPREKPSLARAEAARHLGQIRQELGATEEGIIYLEESVRIREEAGKPVHLPSAYHVLGYARLEAGDFEGAEADLSRARDLAERLDLPLTAAMIARNQADLDLARLAPGVWRRSHP